MAQDFSGVVSGGSSTAEPRLKLKDFGAQVKSKYPQYGKYGDEEIATRMLAKYPKYKDNILPFESPVTPARDLPASSSPATFPGLSPAAQAGIGMGRNIAALFGYGKVEPSVQSEGAAQVIGGMGDAITKLKGLPAQLVEALRSQIGRPPEQSAMWNPAVAAENRAKGIAATKADMSSIAASPVLNPNRPDVTPESFSPSQRIAGELFANAALPNTVAGIKAGITQNPIAQALIEKFPRLERAGGKLEKIKTALAETGASADPSAANTNIVRARELQATGHTGFTPGMRLYEARQQPTLAGQFGGKDIYTAAPPIGYAENFDFASAAKRLSPKVKFGLGGEMGAQVKMFARSLQDANRAMAESVGMGKLFDEAMLEYRQAKSIEAAGKIAAKFARRAAIAGALGGAAATGYEAIHGR